MNANTANKSAVEPPNGETDAASGMRLKAVIRFGIYILILAAILFASAGRLNWIMGWAYMGVYGAIIVASALVIPIDPEFVEERTQAKEGVKAWDKPLAIIGSVLFPTAMLVVAGLDMRFGWLPQVPLALQIAALVIAALGYLLSVWAMASNKFYSRFVRIQKDRGHTVISDGPYRYVRHPGYAGVTIFDLATAPALSSLWTLIPSVLFALLLVVRTALEDRTLLEELDGYREYTQRVRYRLLPGIW